MLTIEDASRGYMSSRSPSQPEFNIKTLYEFQEPFSKLKRKLVENFNSDLKSMFEFIRKKWDDEQAKHTLSDILSGGKTKKPFYIALRDALLERFGIEIEFDEIEIDELLENLEIWKTMIV